MLRSTSAGIPWPELHDLLPHCRVIGSAVAALMNERTVAPKVQTVFLELNTRLTRFAQMSGAILETAPTVIVASSQITGDSLESVCEAEEASPSAARTAQEVPGAAEQASASSCSAASTS